MNQCNEWVLIFSPFYCLTRFDNCHEDWVEISNLYRDGGVHLIGRYCGATSPGPIESSLGAVGLRIFLRTDAEGVYSGFKARYAFEPAKPMFGGIHSLFLY